MRRQQVYAGGNCDYILSSKVALPLISDPALYSLPDGMVAISVTTQTLATGLSDKLQSGISSGSTTMTSE